MLGLKTKSAPKEDEHQPFTYTHRIVYRCPGVTVGFVEPATREQALEAFAQCVAKRHIDPYNGRSMVVLTREEWERLRKTKPEMVRAIEANTIHVTFTPARLAEAFLES